MIRYVVYFFIGLVTWVGVPASVVFARNPNDPEPIQLSYDLIGVTKAWDITVGSRDVIVAVIDNGFDAFHPDLRDNVWKNIDEFLNNGIDDDHNGYIDDVWGWNFIASQDEQGWVGNNDPRPNVNNLESTATSAGLFNHGTFVAGLIGAVGNNGKDGAGINWRVRLMNLRIIDNNGSTANPPLSEAVRYAVNNGAHVINVSAVTSIVTDDMVDAIQYAFQHGVAVIAAAGNDHQADLDMNPIYPICIDAHSSEEWILGVNAVTADRRFAIFSNIGETCIDLTAPGVQINSTLRYSPQNGLNERYGGNWSGTSLATPLVSGAAALIKSIQPTWGARQIYEALLSTTDRTPGTDDKTYKKLFGAGLLQIDRAVQYALDHRSSLYLGVRALWAIDTTTGIFQTRDVASERDESEQHVALRAIDDITTYIDTNGNRVVATIGPFGSGSERAVRLFNEQWGLIDEWSVHLSVPARIVVGDVNDDDVIDIVVTPQQEADVLATIFTINGVFESSIRGYALSGTIPALVHNTDTQKPELVLAFASKGGITVRRYTATMDVSHEFLTDTLSRISGFGVGDIDGNGREAYVLLAHDDDPPYLVYLNTDGSLKRKFLSFDGQTQGSLGMIVVDWNQDGREDVVVFGARAETIRVWSNHSRRLAEWKPFSDKPIKKSILFAF